ALGIDALVAEESMRAGGKTAGVLGHGLGMIYPQSNARLAQKIIDGGGVLLSEFPLDFPPDKYTFPARNRIIAGLSVGTVVLEAPEGSGAIITAELALEYGRDVFAVPGQIFDENYRGCHRLIMKSQARLVLAPEEVLRDIGVIAPEQRETAAVALGSPEEETVYAVLTTMPQALDELVQKTNLETGAINAALTMMELMGAVKNVGAGQWVRR
ncbi:MAG: processing protein, partial [Candidatus Peribacteria bacterium]|nr:processing protein [Candidatus Peribacteria bacterium]